MLAAHKSTANRDGQPQFTTYLIFTASQPEISTAYQNMPMQTYAV